MSALPTLLCLAGTLVPGQGPETLFRAPGVEVNDLSRDIAWLRNGKQSAAEQ
jgi:hypothetical protein